MLGGVAEMASAASAAGTGRTATAFFVPSVQVWSS